MTVNYNNLRMKGINGLISAIEHLNTLPASIQMYERDTAYFKEQLKEKLAPVIDCIVTMACTSNGDDPGFIDLSDKFDALPELFPEPEEL